MNGILITKKTWFAVLLACVFLAPVSAGGPSAGSSGTVGPDSIFQDSITIVEGFESGTLSALGWETAGDRPWFISADAARDGLFSARSGVMEPGQESDLVLDLDFKTQGEFTFWLTTDSAHVGNRLTFFIDGEEQAQWSGRMKWIRFSRVLSKGPHRFTWSYHLDPESPTDRAAAWIDEVAFPRVEGVDPFLLAPAGESLFWNEPFSAPWTRSR